MPTTFNVIYLGNTQSIDPTEGNATAEDADVLVGQTFGSAGSPLWSNIQELSPGSTGFAGGRASSYDQDNAQSNDTFSINGGPDQVFDANALYNATVTYTDGTTALVEVVVFQDTDGNTYLAPRSGNSASQQSLEDGPIRSLTVNSIARDTDNGMSADRESFQAVVCFVSGTQIETWAGLRNVENLAPGDMVLTADRGHQPVRWVHERIVPSIGRYRPVHIEAGALGPGVPRRDLCVSRQHRILIRSRIAERMFGQREILLAAHRLVELEGVSLLDNLGFVQYFHFLCDRHELVKANGTWAETLHLGREAKKTLPKADLRSCKQELQLDHADDARQLARFVPDNKRQRRFVARLTKNAKPAVEPENQGAQTNSDYVPAPYRQTSGDACLGQWIRCPSEVTFGKLVNL